MTARTADCPQHVRAGRFCKAEQFHDAAQGVLALVDDDDNVSDAFVTLCGRRPGAVAAAVFDLLDAYDSRLRHVAREWLDQSAARLRDLGPQDVQPGAADRAAAGLSCTTT